MTQLDILRHSDARMAKAWRAAAETARQQFPDDDERYRYYAREAERLEQESKQ